jgi:hypothetical protein
MHPTLLMALGLTTVLLAPVKHESQTVTERYQTPAWHIDATRDKFTHGLKCRLYQGGRGLPVVAYARGALAFQFSRGLNTTNADFQIDNGPVLPWTSVYPQLVGTGAPLTGKSLDNPTQGKVLLPVERLTGGHLVTIRAVPDHKPRRFSIDGFSDALASARSQGCDVVTGFSF